MKKINSNLRVAELDTVSDVLVRLYKDAASFKDSSIASDANLAGIMAEIENLSVQITTAIKSDRISSALDEADIARDSVVRNLGDALTGYAAIPVAAKKASAEKLLAVFSKYGRQITAKSYAEESSLIESMLEDFGAENLKADIAALDGVTGLLESLRAAQNDFNRKNDELTAANVSKADSASAVKKLLLSAVNSKFVPYVTAVGTLGGYGDFAAKCEAEIVKANATVKGRTKAADKAE